MKQVLSIVALIVLTGCSCNKPADESTAALGEPKVLDHTGCTKDGETRTGFLAPTGGPDFPCAGEIQTCGGGQWHGPPLYDRCIPFKPK